MRKITKVLLTVGAICLVHRAGIIKGHNQCLNNLKKTYGDEIFGDKEFIVDKVAPGSFIFIRKGLKKGE